MPRATGREFSGPFAKQREYTDRDGKVNACAWLSAPFASLPATVPRMRSRRLPEAAAKAAQKRLEKSQAAPCAARRTSLCTVAL
jgi:hypothetical protein